MSGLLIGFGVLVQIASVGLVFADAQNGFLGMVLAIVGATIVLAGSVLSATGWIIREIRRERDTLPQKK